MPKIDARLCMGCGVCEYICPADVYRVTRKKKAYLAFPEDCVGLCWLCLQRCPVKAISWKDHKDKWRKEFSPDFAWQERSRAWGLIADEEPL